MLDPTRSAAFALSAGRVVSGCRQLERRVEDQGQMIAALLTRVGVADNSVPRQDAPASLQGACLEQLQDLGSAVKSLRLVLEELMAAVIEPPLAAMSVRALILVVDDHDDTRELIASTLKLADLDVKTANNGLEGLLAAHVCRPALIVMDVHMPVLTGIEATRLLKATAALSGIPVIAHTARPDVCRGCAPELFAHVLPKPTHPDVLLALVRRFVPLAAPPTAGGSQTSRVSPTLSPS